MSKPQRTVIPWVAAGLAALAGAAIFNRASAEKAERDYPPVGSIIEVDGVSVHYTDSGGTGDPVVLVHGNGSLVQDFHRSGLVSQLSRTHRVIAFDRPGYGYTTRPDDRDWSAEAQAAILAIATRRLGVNRPILVGHSWGTLVTTAWALAHPEGVKAMVLLSGYYYPSPRPDAQFLKIADLPLIGQVFTDAWAPLQTRIVGPLGNKMIFSPAEVPSNFIDEMPFALMLRPSQLRATAQDSAQMPANVARLAKRYDDLALPIVVIWGDGDKLVKQSEQSGRLVAQLPSAAGEATPGVGHMIHHTRPDVVAAGILALA